MRKLINTLAITAIVVAALIITGTIALRLGLDAGQCTGYKDCAPAGELLRTYAGFTVNFQLVVYIIWPLSLLSGFLSLILLPIGWLIASAEERRLFVTSTILVIVAAVMMFWEFKADNAFPTDRQCPIYLPAFVGSSPPYDTQHPSFCFQ